MNQITVDSSLTLIKSLCETKSYNYDVATVRLIETHISWVLLTGKYAYKIKKPVNFGFLDFSTLEKRHFFCQEELRLNQRLAAEWYLDVVPITGQPEHPEMDGTGEAIEYAVKMRQFPCIHTLKEAPLSIDEIDQIASIVADFHQTTDRADAQSIYGDSHDIHHWFVENFCHIRPLLNNPFQLLQLDAIDAWGYQEWTKKSLVMQMRKQQGYVRECHGDLHSGNMTLVNGKVILFDCIEFNPMLRWIDVISDVAFLVTDLLHLGYHDYAYRFLNRYLQATGDYQGLALLRYYLVYRALIRAKVALLRLKQHPDAAVCTEVRDEYAAFADLTERFTQDSKTVLIITHGFSGAGKSTLSEQLAETIGALQIRSDIERKRLYGYQPQATTNGSIYTQEAGKKTYQHLAELAKKILEAGFSAIIDATFLKAEYRNMFRQLAGERGIKFFILDFQASDETLYLRIRQRRDDASEATFDVLRQQQQSAESLGREEQNQVIIVDTESDTALASLFQSLGQQAC